MSTMIQYVLYLAILDVLAIPLGAYINFFVQSSDTVRKPDLQGYACRQRRTDDMEKICGKCNDFFRYRACFSVPASTSAGSSSRKPAESFRREMGFGI